MSLSLTFVSMTDNDIADVLAIEKTAFGDPWSQKDFEDELTNPRSTVLLARERHEQLVGYVVFWTVADEVQILDIAVDKQHKRQGIGRALMAKVLEHTAQHQCRSIHLECRRSNTAAVGLYEALGFKRMAIRHRYYNQGKEDAIVMQLTLGETQHGV